MPLTLSRFSLRPGCCCYHTQPLSAFQVLYLISAAKNTKLREEGGSLVRSSTGFK